MMPSLMPDGPPMPDDIVCQAATRLAEGDAQSALALLKPLVGEGESGLAARFVLAMIAWQLEKFDWALQILRQCHDEAPNNGTVAETLASLYAQIGNLGESLFIGKLSIALAADAQFATLVPDRYPGFDRAFLSIKENPLLAKARQALADGKLAETVDKARQHVALAPDHLDGRSFYGAVLLRAGLASTAVEALAVVERDAACDASSIGLYARALAASGEAEAARAQHDRAASAAPADAAIAAARVADALWLGEDSAGLAALARDWAHRFCPPPRPARPLPASAKLVVGYLVSSFLDPQDAAAVAAVAQAHDRDRTIVLGFGRGSYTAEENAVLTGAFTKWRDIGALDPATLARTLAGDGVQVLVDGGGFAAAQQLQALARCSGAIRVSWLGNPGGILAPLYDRELGPGAYPVLGKARDLRAAKTGTIAFGADAGMAQIDRATVALWASVLQAVPAATLVLRGNDMAAGANLTRLVRLFGSELAARIDIRAAALAEEFYQVVDIALLPCRGASPRAAAEALGHGVPVVALAGPSRAEPYGGFLADRGLGRFVAADAGQYRAIAAELAQSSAARELGAIEDGAHRVAATIEACRGD